MSRDRSPHLPPRLPRRGPSRPPGRLAGAVAGIAVALALAAALGGCGSGGSSGSNADPAGVVPGSSPVYVSAVVRPEGDLKSNAQAVGQKLSGQNDPYKRLVALLQTPGSPALSYSSDVAPWLGEHAGVFFQSLGRNGSIEALLRQALASISASAGPSAAWPFGVGAAQGAMVLDTSDLAKAQSFVASAASHAGAQATSYKGVSYQASAGGQAFAIVEKLVVLGSVSGVRAVIETSQGGQSLKSDPTYSQLLAAAPSQALAHLYANPANLPQHAAAGHAGASNLLETLAGTRPLDLSLVPAASSVALDADVGPPPAGTANASAGLVGSAASGGQAFGRLPGESWLAAGFGDFGGASGGELKGLQGLLSLLESLAGNQAAPKEQSGLQISLSVKGIVGGLLVPLKALSSGPQAQRDFLSWMGEAGIFASGTSVLELKAGVVIDSKNAAASRAAVSELASAMNRAGGEATPVTVQGTEAAVEAKVTGLPVTLVIAAGKDSLGHPKFVIGLSSTSVLDALNPSSTIASSSTYTLTKSALGEGAEPTLAVNVASLVSLLEGIGLSEDPSVAGLLPYLRASSSLSGGGKELGSGIERLRLVLSLPPASH
ncbi:MAG TPA: DUF3352 domain-containing protein [Solirubrobacteraceae bacterium]|nr:DUF3352 domain-containing protein [Solirubrobacteraceae bacterium]